MSKLVSRVSVIIPTFNRCRLLLAALDSARRAYSGPLEILIVDDASTDNTQDACASIEDVRYLRQDHNKGMSAGRNTGAAASTGEFVVFLDDDDELFPGALDAGVRTLVSEPKLGFYYGQAWVRRPDGSNVGDPFPGRCPQGDIFWECVSGFGPCIHAAIVRREAFEAIGGFNERLRHIEDPDLWARLSERYDAGATMDVIGFYREPRAGSGQSSSQTSLRADIGLAVQSRWLNLPRAKAATKGQRMEARRRYLAKTSDHLIFAAGAALDDGLRGHARTNLLTALRLHPRRALRARTLKLLWKSIA